MTTRVAATVAALVVCCFAGAPPAAAQGPTPTAPAQNLPFHAFLPAVRNDREVPLRPLVQIGGRMSGIDFAGHYALIGVGPRVIVMDVADPAALREVGSSPSLPGTVLDVTVHAGYAYARIASPLQVAVLDLREITVPRIAGYFDPPDAVRDITFGPELAYVCDAAGLRVRDARDPLLATQLGELRFEGGAQGCGRLDKGLVVVRTLAPEIRTTFRTRVVRIIDVADPAAPREIGTFGECMEWTRQWCGPHFVDGNRVYLRGVNSRFTVSIDSLQAVDLTEAPAADDLGFLSFWSAERTLGAVTGNRGLMFAQVQYVGLLLRRMNSVYDLSQPGEGRLIGEVEARRAASAMRAQGSTLLTIGHGIEAVDVRDPAAPRSAGEYDVPGEVWHVEASGDRLYTSCASGSMLCLDGQILRAFDVRAPVLPRQAATLDIGAAIADLAATETRVLALAGQALHVIAAPRADILQPEAILRFIDDEPEAVAASGARAVLLSRQKRLSVVDLAAEGGPRVAGITTLDTIPGTWLNYGAIRDLVVVGNRAFIALEAPKVLLMADITDPAAPRVVGQVDLDYGPQGIAVRGDLVFVAGGDAGLRVLRVAADGAGGAGEIGRLPLRGAAAVALDGPNAYVTGAGGLLYAVDVADPTQPQLANSQAVAGTPGRLSAAGGGLWVAAREGGLYGFASR